jgi:UDP-glucose 4-epimerase
MLVADASQARRVLGFRSSRSWLGQIVASAWKWHCQAHPLRQ